MKQDVAKIMADAKSKQFSIKMRSFCGETGDKIPVFEQEEMRLVGGKDGVLFREDSKGNMYSLNLKYPELVEYENGCLRIFAIGTRPLTTTEEQALIEWDKEEEKPDFARLKAADELTGTREARAMRMKFFDDLGVPYMSGREVNGVRYRAYKKKLFDGSIKGALILEFEIEKK